jgi:hypothetical protein
MPSVSTDLAPPGNRRSVRRLRSAPAEGSAELAGPDDPMQGVGSELRTAFLVTPRMSRNH